MQTFVCVKIEMLIIQSCLLELLVFLDDPAAKSCSSQEQLCLAEHPGPQLPLSGLDLAPTSFDNRATQTCFTKVWYHL